MATKKKTATKKSNGKTAKVKPVEIITGSEIARRYGLTRQSIRSWIMRHDTFPSPVFGHDMEIPVTLNGKAVTGKVYDPHGKALFFIAREVDDWVSSGAVRRRTDENGNHIPAAKKPAAKKKAAAKKTTTKKAAATTTKKKGASVKKKTSAKKKSVATTVTAKKKPASAARARVAAQMVASKKASTKKGSTKKKSKK